MSDRHSRDSILVIDDDADIRTLIETVAVVNGVRVLQAANCRSGIKILEREHDRIRLILLDYIMPGSDPARCTEALVAIAGPKIPVVLITAAYDPAARAAELKLKRWIAKPFQLSSLRELLGKRPVRQSR